MEPESESPWVSVFLIQVERPKNLKSVSDLFLFVCMCLNERKPHMCVLTKAQRESRVSWSWRYRQLGTTQTGCQEPSSGPLEEHQQYSSCWTVPLAP